MQQALAEWGEHALYLALDTSQLGNKYCLIRLSVVFRGRAVPLVWRVQEHPSAMVSFQAYKQLLDAAAKLFPAGVKVVLLADRGFADTGLMRHAKKLGWHYRIRIKCSFIVWRHGKRYKVEQIGLRPGQALFLQHISLTDARFGPVYPRVREGRLWRWRIMPPMEKDGQR